MKKSSIQKEIEIIAKNIKIGVDNFSKACHRMIQDLNKIMNKKHYEKIDLNPPYNVVVYKYHIDQIRKNYKGPIRPEMLNTKV